MAPGGALRTIGRMALLFGAYFATARLGLMFEPVAGVATPVWPPTGLSLAVLWLFGAELWPAVGLAAFAVNALVGVPLVTALGIGAGNTLEALVGVYCLRRTRVHPALDRARDAILLVVLAALVSTTISASFGAASLWIGHVPSDLPLVWRTWWLGDVMGDILVAPPLLAWARPTRAAPGRAAEGIALTLAQALIVALVFVRGTAGAAFARTYLLFPGLIWAARRFGQRGSTTVMLVTAIVAVGGTALGHGPFGGGARLQNLLALQAFLGVVAVTLLLLGATVEERSLAVSRREQVLEVVSHDLRNPLSSIMMNGAYLLAHPDSDPARARQQLEIIVNAAQRMNRLVGDLRDAVQIETGELPLTIKTQSLDALIGAALQILQPTAQQRGQRIEVELAFDAQVRCDGDRIAQVLQNLLGNAIKFTPEGGTIRVRASRTDGFLCIDVDDSGPGIPEAQRTRVFDRYWRANRAEGQGLGLGLYIAKEIVRAHGGKIWVADKEGTGCLVRFTLPAA